MSDSSIGDRNSTNESQRTRQKYWGRQFTEPERQEEDTTLVDPPKSEEVTAVQKGRKMTIHFEDDKMFGFKAELPPRRKEEFEQWGAETGTENRVALMPATEPMPDDGYLILSIVNAVGCLFSALPCGIVALGFSIMSRRARQQGMIRQAKKHDLDSIWCNALYMLGALASTFLFGVIVLFMLSPFYTDAEHYQVRSSPRPYPYNKDDAQSH